MALTDATKTTDFAGFITPENSSAIFEKVKEGSVVQSVVQQTPLAASGQKVPVVTGEMSADWVSEAGLKPASEGSLTQKDIVPEKIATIAVVSAELLRANPGGYIDLIRPQIAHAFARAFDRAALYGDGPFTTYLSQTTRTVAVGTANANGGAAPAAGGAYKDLVNVLDSLVSDDKELTGWLLDTVLEPTLLSTVDTAGHPTFVNAPFTATAQQAARIGQLLGRPSAMSKHVKDTVPGTVATSYTVGFGGDFSQAAWGVVGGITYDVSTEATVTLNGQLVSAFTNNLVAIRAEAEFGFLVNDVDSFVEMQFKTPAA